MAIRPSGWVLRVLMTGASVAAGHSAYRAGQLWLRGSRLVTALNQLLLHVAELLRLLLESLSVLTVLLGVLVTLRQALRRQLLGAVRLELGRWLSMALEFQLAADIVATTISPNGQQLIQLAAIALIRTFLNVALSREAQAEHSLQPAQR